MPNDNPKEFTNTQKVLLATNTVLWTIASFAVKNFFSDGPEMYPRGIKNLWPLEGFGRFKHDFSIEEWLIFAAGPWIVVYFLNRGKDS